MLQIALFLIPFTLKRVETTTAILFLQLLLSPKRTDEALALCKISGGQEIQEMPEATHVRIHWLVLTHRLFCSAYLLIHAQTVEASNRDPCPLTIQNSPVDQTCVQAIAQPFDMVSDVNLQGTVDFGYQFQRATILGIHDLEARRAL
ncbi:hypothetical protein EUGRSUZ_K00121 [Eucalyptus grandis]|uniref:Uncharacterized protein n=2 Tax=Eucalyptus grandis TaxID=71139 RepID=A0ACC3IPE5_EUCGR|nr:hypothetical protein EUGRSUZ_K00121 [Eucalyptus grandis]